MPTLPAYKAGRAETCWMEKINESGSGVVYYVRLPDGYMIDCGSGPVGGKRADFVRDAVNVAMKWAYEFPPVGVIESVVRNSFADEDRHNQQERKL